MIGAILENLFSSKKAKKNGPELNADRHFAKPINCCPSCKSPAIKKTVWRRAGFQSRTTARIVTERYGLGCEIEWECPCGFKHNGPLFQT